MTTPLGMSPQAFRSRRDHSIQAVERVAQWAEGRGADVIVPTPPPIIPGVHNHDSGDLYVNGHRVEVKWRHGLKFTRTHFPFPTCYLCAVHQWEQAHPRPEAFVILNESMTGALVFKVATTRRHWTRRNIYNHVEQRPNVLYECPARLGRFTTLSQ